ncbi:TIGR01244 family phosphatase [Alcaligenaceae bacterium CGII-47]|nr:TIGR01244 family phosphatase [Alcaligenaceae bacterium CGII-47]
MTFSYHSLSETFAVAPQLAPEDMRALADAGFKAVIINRPDGEGGAEQPTSKAVIDAARAAGLEARYQPVVSGSITQADVATFAELLHALPTPILAYCRSGARCSNLYQSAQALDAPQNPD